ncbi:MAG: hypothetical protein J6S67_00610 [Methanobrevibacter sp.]|nr:hypothetical protein [Methanobrevibacter sp.]
MKKYTKIFCPCCNAEYLPCEIYVPSAVFGKPFDIDKNNMGRIKSVHGDNSCNEEEYTCDYCGTKFYVYAKITFRTDIHRDNSFSEEHVIKVNDKVELSEE